MYLTIQIFWAESYFNSALTSASKSFKMLFIILETALAVYRGAFKTCHISKIELCEKIDNGWKLLIIVTKSSILDVWQGSEYASDIDLLMIGYLQFYDTSLKDFLDLANICGCSTPSLSV